MSDVTNVRITNLENEVARLQAEIVAAKEDLATRESTPEFQQAKTLYNRGIIWAGYIVNNYMTGDECDYGLFRRQKGRKYKHCRDRILSRANMRQGDDFHREVLRHLQNICVEKGITILPRGSILLDQEADNPVRPRVKLK